MNRIKHQATQHPSRSFRTAGLLLLAAGAALALSTATGTRLLAQDTGKTGDPAKTSGAGQPTDGDKPKDDKAKPPGKDGAKDGKNAYTALMHNRRRGAITTDFMLTNPAGTPPKGLTPEEAALVHASIRAVAAHLLKQTPGNEDVSDFSADAWNAVAVWALCDAGVPETDPGMKARLAFFAESIASGPKRKKPAGKAKPPDGKDANPAEDMTVSQMAMSLRALQAMAEARDREAQKAAKKDEWIKTPAERKKRAGELGKRLKPEEVRAATAIRTTLLARQIRVSKNNEGPGMIDAITAGGWAENFLPGPLGMAGADATATFYAVLGLAAAYSIGLDAPPKEAMESAARYVTSIQQKKGDAASLSFMDGKLIEAKEPNEAADRRLRLVSTQIRGCSRELTFDPGMNGTADKDAKGRDPADLGPTAETVCCLVLARWMAADGAPSAADTETAKKADRGIESAMAWVIHNSQTADGGDGKPPKRGHYPLGNECDFDSAGTLSTAMMCVLTGSESLGTIEWYPVGARHWVEILEPMRKKGKGGGADNGMPPGFIVSPCQLLFLLSGFDKTPGGDPAGFSFGRPMSAPAKPPADAPPGKAPAKAAEKSSGKGAD